MFQDGLFLLANDGNSTFAQVRVRICQPASPPELKLTNDDGHFWHFQKGDDDNGFDRPAGLELIFYKSTVYVPS